MIRCSGASGRMESCFFAMRFSWLGNSLYCGRNCEAQKNRLFNVLKEHIMYKAIVLSRAAVFCLGLSLCLSIEAQAQNPPTLTSAEIYLRMKKLNVLGTVLYVAAH